MKEVFEPISREQKKKDHDLFSFFQVRFSLIDSNTSLIGGKHTSSALLLSFFMMSMLILVSLGVSYLVIQDLSTMRTVVGGMQATYAAEGMSEIGLHMVKENLPGYENEILESEDYFDVTIASLDLMARSKEIPCEGQGEEDWLRLSKNESVQLPLFVQDDEEGEVLSDAENFTVFFYLGDENGDEINPKIDVLRWKIIGFSGSKTEAISAFIPLDPEKLTSAANPTEMGTNVTSSKYSQGKYTSNGGFTANMLISSFMDNHEYNYLVLTNVYESSKTYIYYRMETSEALACPYVEVNGLASNEFGEARQSLTTFMKEGENLPAYDFVLYNTDYEEGEEETLIELSDGGVLDLWPF
ncbi:MAG: hypothetical protein ACI9QC_000898 [Oceanicoccus sp.]|jgi:hypothetical protein